MKQGFLGTPTIAEEYGSARNANLTSNKFGAFFSSLLAKKQEICTFQDTSKRKPLFNPKESLWLVTPRNKPQVDIWFRDLASSKSLTSVARKVPIFNKKEDILLQLFEHQVPMFKAAFYIKALASVSAANTESGTKNKKRQTIDPGQEWSQTITRYLYELIKKMTDQGAAPSDYLKQWVYVKDLARHMFDEDLLDQYDFLSWILETFERMKMEDPILRLITPLLLQYSEDFANFEILSRKLAYNCCRRLNTLLSDAQDSSTGEERNVIQDLMACPQHRSITLTLSCIVQIITLRCKAALVWHPPFDSKLPASVVGSPLDQLPCTPSSLPTARNLDEKKLKEELLEAEEEIRWRSAAAENKWASERWHATGGTPTTRLLSTLDLLDKHCFDKIDSHSSLDILYSKIFTSITRSNEELDNDFIREMVTQDEPKIRLLCEWAVTHKRSGEHRSMVVAKLLERRQSELTQERDPDGNDDGTSESEHPSLSNQAPVFQPVLFNFLDTQAPILDEKNSRLENRISFSNLVLLFSELIRCDVFSHDAYMSTLISRGLFVDTGSAPASTQIQSDLKVASNNSAFLAGFNHAGGHAPGSSVNADTLHRHSSESSLPMFDPVDTAGHGPTQGLSWDTTQMDVDDAGIDADLDKLLQNIKEGQQNNNHDQDILLPDKVSPVKEDEPSVQSNNSGEISKSTAQRHLLYTTHFPIPQDETTLHECNQRHILLYGVGRAREEARHAVKKVTKEILKLFSRKASHDISEGGKVKKSAVKDGFSFESALNRFQSLSFFDQHCVTSTCASACIEMLNAVATGSASYLPLVESIAFLFDLMDMALNVHGVLEFIIQMLRELVEVEVQLIQKCPILAGSYTSSIGLYIVGVLFRYQPCLLVSQDDTFAVFEGCLKLVKHVINPADCSSAERCILGYIFDLYSSCSLLHSKYQDLSTFLAKIKMVIYAQIQPSNLTLIPNTSYMMEHINNPKLKPDAIHLKNLNENPISRYSFVCNAVKAIAATKDPNLINELAILCAELSARCPQLCADWIGLLRSLCCSSNHAFGFMDALSSREISDTSIHDNLAIFTSILVARRCFSLQDLVIHCALPSLLAACPQGGGDQEAEPGARLTCHLLLCLFRTSEPPLSSSTVTSTPATTLYSLTSPGPANLTPTRPTYLIKHPCDRYLLAAAHSCMRVEAVIAVLKAILVLGDANTDPNRQEVNVNDLLGSIDEEFGDFIGMPFGSRSSRQENMENAGLGEFAKLALKQICSQDWVHEKCLRDREMLCKQDLLLDTMLSAKQAQQLLDMICHPKGSGPTCTPDYDQKAYITHILQNLDEWTLRISWLQLQLVYAQCSTSQGSGEVHNWLDNVAKAIVDFFQSCSEDIFRSKHPPPPPSSKSSRNSQQKQPPSFESIEAKEARVWLVAPLVSKLPSTLQGKILKAAAAVLENGNWMTPAPTPGSYSSSSKSKDRFSQPKGNNSAALLLSYPPFLALVLMCLRGQDEQRSELLKSLYGQLDTVMCEKPTDDVKTRLAIHEGLQLRLSLVGGMFDMILKSTTTMHDWGILLVNLISRGVVDGQLNYELFTTILDMLSALIHSTQCSDPDESRKQYQNLLKKLRKELPHDKPVISNFFAISAIRQLVPCSKYLKTIVTCEPMGSLIDTKGNKIAGFDSIDKKQGLQVADKMSINPWELLEGQKNPAPLCWSWFGVVRYERKPLKCDELINSLQRHSHSLRKPTTYFLEPPPLPPEETEPVVPAAPAPPLAPVPEAKVQLNQPVLPIPAPPYSLMSDEAARREPSTPTETMSPRAAPKAKAPKKPRQRKNAKNQSPVQVPGHQTPPVRAGHPGFGDGFGGPPMPQQQIPQQQQQPPQNWYPNMGPAPPQVAHPGPVQGQQAYVQPQFAQGQMLGPGQQPRFEQRAQTGKAALNSLLRARNHPQIHAQANNGPQPAPNQQQHVYQRQPRPQQQNPQMPPQPQMVNQGMYHVQGHGQPNMGYNQQMQPMDQQQHHFMNQQYVQQQQQQPIQNRPMRPQMQQHQFMQRYAQHSYRLNINLIFSLFFSEGNTISKCKVQHQM